MERCQVPRYVMSTLCRICAEKSATLTPIFESESLPVKIYKCLPIEVKESDYLPLKVCETCFAKINESYMFYLKADEADQRLKKLWKILLKETMTDEQEVFLNQEKAVVVINDSQSSVNVPKEMQTDIKPFTVTGVPQEVSYKSIEISENCDQFLDELPNEIMIVDIDTGDSFEVINKNFVLKSLEKSNHESLKVETEPSEIHISEFDEKTPHCDQMEQTAELYQCRFCPQKFSSDNLGTHESTHSEEKPYLCDTCGKSFKHAKYLRSHARIHSSVRKKYICKICSKGFLTNFFLQEHMNSHTGDTPYKCSVCGKEFREKVHLRQHKWTHSNQKFACPVCGSKFNRKGNMTEHVKHCHKDGGAVVKMKTSQTGEVSSRKNSNFKCPACSCEFVSNILLKNHVKIHSEPKRFGCGMCGKKFRHSGSLTYHRRAAHTGERPFQCNYCEQKFSLRSVQIIHERKNHTFEHPYKCSFCSRPFTNSSSLRNHLYIHSKDKMFNCEECGKKFSRSSNLMVHRKLHSGDRKFACDQCGKKYIQKHDLVKHKKVHDPKSKPFFCKYCGNSFSHKKDSVKHAMCQFDFLRKNNSEFYSAEKMLDSVTNDLEKPERDFSAEEEQQLILESVEELTEERSGVIYEDIRGLRVPLQ